MKGPSLISTLLAQEIKDAVEQLQRGNIILCPTDTIWGLSCDSHNRESYQKIYEIKGREAKYPFVLLASNLEMLKEYVHRIPPRIENLLVYFEHPITIVYPEVKNLPRHCLAEDGSVAIRITGEPYSKMLIESFGRPICSTSANISGMPYPKHFGEISSDIFDRVDYISSYGRNNSQGIPSQIFRFDKEGKLERIRK